MLCYFLFLIALVLSIHVASGSERNTPMKAINFDLHEKNYQGRISRFPVKLVDLIRIDNKNKRAKDPSPRTSPQFLAGVLRLYPGQLPHFPRQRWDRLKSSQLYRNLSLTATVLQDHSVQYQVSGEELPSRMLRPELSARVEGTTPVVDGAIKFVDKNLNGQGQRLMLSIAGREKVSAEAEQLNTDPIYEAEWEDWSLDGERIELGYKHDFSEGAPRLLRIRSQREVERSVPSEAKRTNSAEAAATAVTTVTSTGAKVSISSIFAKFSRRMFSTPKFAVNWSINLFGKSITRGKEGESQQLSGALNEIRISSDWIRKMDAPSSPITLWWESGKHVAGCGAINAFHRFGASMLLSSQLHSQRGSSHRAITRVGTNQHGNASIVASGSGSEQSLGIIRLHLKGMSCSGEGILPYFHHEDIGSDSLVRGYRHQYHSSSATLDRSARSYVAAKIDYVARGVLSNLSLIPGWFLDGALFNSDATDAQAKRDGSQGWQQRLPWKGSALVTGPSLRFRGFKAEAAFDCFGIYRQFTHNQTTEHNSANYLSPSLRFGMDFVD